jgi:uncharacterized protein YkwD
MASKRSVMYLSLFIAIAFSWPLIAYDDQGAFYGEPESYKTLNIEPETFLNLINRARAQGHRCGGRYYPPVPPLRWNRDLLDAAQRHADDMASHGFMSHTGSDGSQPHERLDDTGYQAAMSAENVASGYKTPVAAINGWLASPSHCAALLNGGYVEMGVAYAENPRTRDRFYWTGVFASSGRW